VWYDESMKKLKSPKQMERHLKGMANHYRIQILFLVSDREKITLEEIVRELKANQKTIGQHTRRLQQSGLINKKYRDKFVEHSLSPYGKIFVRFLKSFQRIQYNDHPNTYSQT
jgi:predicted transcriptional regulator